MCPDLIPKDLLRYTGVMPSGVIASVSFSCLYSSCYAAQVSYSLSRRCCRVVEPILSATGYGFIALSREDYRYRSMLIAFLFTTVALNMLVTVLMGRSSLSHALCFAWRITLNSLSSGPYILHSTESSLHTRSRSLLKVHNHDCHHVRLIPLLENPFLASKLFWEIVRSRLYPTEWNRVLSIRYTSYLTW